MGRKGLCEGGGDCLKYLKREWNRKDGRKTKILKRGGQARSMSGCLKKGELEPPYELLTMCAISSKLAIKILGRRQRL